MESVSQILFLFHKGGPVMYALLAASIIVVAIAIERYRFYRMADCDVDAFLAAVAAKLDCGDRSGAAEVCRGTGGLTPQVLATGLTSPVAGVRSLENRLEGAAAQAAAKLRQRLNYLATMVTLAPLLGLLGTVIGMISTFNVLAIRTGSPSLITGGVGEALVATAAGLCVAMMALVAHSYFSQRLDTIVSGMERACTWLADREAGGDGHAVS